MTSQKSEFAYFTRKQTQSGVRTAQHTENNISKTEKK